MSKKIIGVTVGTPMSPSFLKDKLNPVTSINGVTADENGNVEITIPDSGGGGNNTVPPLMGTTDEITPSQVFQAFVKGQQVMLSHTEDGIDCLFSSFNLAGSPDVYSAMIFSTIVGFTGNFDQPQCEAVMLFGSTEGRTWSVMHQQLPAMADVPTDEYIQGLIEAELKNQSGSGGNVDYKWAGKVASFLGDSITEGVNTEKTYHAFLREKVGFSICNNYGINGSSVSNKNTPMCTRVSNVAENSDIIFVFGGTNDFYFSVPIGEWYTIDGTTRTVNYDTSTFRGALSTLCDALLTKFPDRKIVLLTPLHRHTFGSQYTELQENAEGLYFEDYVDAIKEAGKMYGLPVIDLYGESGLFPRNEANAAIYFHTNDKLHPNAKGHEVIANVILGFLEKTYPMVSGQASDEPDEPAVFLTSITATYSGEDVTVGIAVSDLSGVTVTAYYSDGTSKNVTGYTLSGTIAEGSNTITVSYGGKTTTFTVVGVVEPDAPDILHIDFSKLTKEPISIHGDGTTKTYNSWYTYENVDCSAHSYVVYNNVHCYNDGSVDLVGLAFYDTNGAFISGIGKNEADEYTNVDISDSTPGDCVISGTCSIPENATSIRIAISTNDKMAAYVTEVTLCNQICEHVYTSEVTTTPTCTTGGLRTYTCECGHTYTEKIPATGHNYVDGVCAVCGFVTGEYGGKTFTMKSYYTNSLFDFTAIVKVDSDCENGNVVKLNVSGSNTENLQSVTASGLSVFRDDTGVCGNASDTPGKVANNASTTTTVDENGIVTGNAEYTLNTNVTTTYIKIPICFKPVSTSSPSKFTIEDISVTVNGNEKEIIAIGGFFTKESWELT